MIHNPLGHLGWLAGGAVRDALIGRQPKDLDYFFESRAKFTKARDLLLKDSASVVSVGLSSVILDHDRTRFELIGSTFYPDISAVLNSFDLTAVQFGLVGAELVGSELAHQDLQARRLRLYQLTDPVSTLTRLRKLIRAGWTDPDQLESHVAQVVQARPTPFHVYRRADWVHLSSLG
jgi:hypothetical protein